MQLSELLAVPGLAGCATRPIPQLSVDRVCDDSRRVSSGCLFVAVEGAVSDGHDYLQSAYRLGCRAFVVEKRQDELPEDAFVFLDVIRHKSGNIFAECNRMENTDTVR